MAAELDDILLAIDCPKCGAFITAPFGTVRITKAIACGCGALVRVEDDTPVASVQQLIDELAPPVGAND